MDRTLGIDHPNQIRLPRRINMQDVPIERMSADKVEQFDVWIFDSQNLAVSVVPHNAPWSATTEDYEVSEQ